MQVLDDALALLDDNHVLYETLNTICRRLVNQALFHCFMVLDPDTVQAERTTLYDHIAQLAQDLQEAKKAPEKAANRPRTARNKARSPQDDHDPFSRGRGSYENNMAGLTGQSSNHDLTWRRIRELHAQRFSRDSSG
jgi:hypothetical protein